MNELITCLTHLYSMYVTSHVLWVVLYFVPAVLCLVGVSFELYGKYEEDLHRREGDSGGYEPSLTARDLVWGVFASCVPLANLLAGYLLYAPDLLKEVYRPLGRFLDLPLVPRTSTIPKSNTGEEMAEHPNEWAGIGANETRPRPELLDLAMSCGATLTGKPDDSEAITVVFSIEAWRAFDKALLAGQTPMTQAQREQLFASAEARMLNNPNLSWRNTLIDEVERYYGFRSQE